MKPMLEKLFSGEHKYTVGLLFIFSNLAGYFLNMRKLNISDGTSILILAAMASVARIIV